MSWARPRSSARRRRLAVAVALLGLPLWSGARVPFPYTLSLHTISGDPPVSRALIERYEDELLERLSSRGCFARVERLAPGAEPRTDLVLRSRLDEFTDNVTYELSRAERQAASNEEDRRRLVAEFAVRVRAELLALPSAGRVRADAERIETTARPERFGQDDVWAREEARRKGLRRMAQHAAALACKGSVRSLARKIERARTGRR